MILHSMTGFGRASGTYDTMDWSWELRAVNNKGLDIRLRLPPGFERLEPEIRKATSQVLSRGSIQMSLTLKRGQDSPTTTINEDVLRGVLTALEKVEQSTAVSKSSGAEILALRGVLEVADGELNSGDSEKFDEALRDGFDVALQSLTTHRASEGAELKDILLDQISQIERLTSQADKDPSRSPEAIKTRLQQQLARLGDAAGNMDQDRLYQETALLATKADIREELDRLAAHTRSATEFLANGSPIGRKLEFLGQEFNRETNTLCSKSNSVELTAIGLELKVVIDQFREQVLNVE